MTILGETVESVGVIFNPGAAELETARVRFFGENEQNAIIVWSHTEGPTGVRSKDTIVLMTTHSAGNTFSVDSPKFLRRERSFLVSICFSQLAAGRDRTSGEAQSEFRKAREPLSVFPAFWDRARNNFNNYQATQ